MSKTEKIREKYVDLDISLFSVLDALDATKTKKYLETFCKITRKILGEGVQTTNETDLKKFMVSFFEKSLTSDGQSVIQEFSDLMENIEDGYNKNNDIQKYKTFDEVINENKKSSDKRKEKELESQVTKHYEDDEWLVLEPLSFEASEKYGANTKWCTTSSKWSFESHTNNRRLIYLINKKNDKKYGLNQKLEEINIWTELNEKVDIMTLILGGDLTNNIFNILLDILKNTKQGTIVDTKQDDITNVSFNEFTPISGIVHGDYIEGQYLDRQISTTDLYNAWVDTTRKRKIKP